MTGRERIQTGSLVSDYKEMIESEAKHMRRLIGINKRRKWVWVHDYRIDKDVKILKSEYHRAIMSDDIPWGRDAWLAK